MNHLFAMHLLSPVRIAFLLTLLFLVPFASSTVAGGTGLDIVQEWFVPQPEAQLREDYLVVAPRVSAIADTVITVSVPIAATMVVVDHWEDGYEVNLKSPVQSSSEIWGDGNNANGKPPGFVNDPASFSPGTVVTMRNNVSLPRNASTLLYDGRDRLGATYGIVMTRAAWFTDPGPLLANSIEVRAVNDWGNTFVLPVGEDVIYPAPLTSSCSSTAPPTSWPHITAPRCRSTRMPTAPWRAP